MHIPKYDTYVDGHLTESLSLRLLSGSTPALSRMSDTLLGNIAKAGTLGPHKGVDGRGGSKSIFEKYHAKRFPGKFFSKGRRGSPIVNRIV